MDGKNALKCLQLSTYDLILMDVMMVMKNFFFSKKKKKKNY